MRIFGFEIKRVRKGKIATSSPYLEKERLADLITAIQILGSYKYASRFYNHWRKQLDTPVSADSWFTLFKAHPEFFRVSGTDINKAMVTLRWRHGFDNNYWAEKGILLSAGEIEKTEKATEGLDDPITLTKRPLTSDEIESLINTAINLHGRAIAYAEERRWLIPVIVAVLASFFSLLGAIIGALLGAKCN